MSAEYNRSAGLPLYVAGRGCNGTGVSDNATQRHSRARGQRKPTGAIVTGSLDIYSEATPSGTGVFRRAGNERFELIVKRISSFPAASSGTMPGPKIDDGDGDNVACETRNRMAI